MPFGFGIWEIVILVVILLLLFGGKGLPGMARRLGTGLREVKDAVEEIDPRSMMDGDDKKENGKKDEQPAQSPPKQLPDAEVISVGDQPQAAPASSPAPSRDRDTL